jgi:Uma2 family endonuclease/uncharacterized protein YciI
MQQGIRTYIIKLTIVVDRETYEPYLIEHMAYLETLKQRGVLLLSGPFMDRTGGLVVVHAESRTEAELIARNDPLVKRGLDTYELREWNITDGLRMWDPRDALRARITQRLDGTTRRLDTSTQRLPSLSYEEFLEWADPDMLIEWVDGEVIIASPDSNKKQVIREFLHNVLRIFVGVNKLGIVRVRCKMKLQRSGREPDLLFVTTEQLDKLKPTHLDGPANMVVEISSPDNIGHDRGDKFYEYEQAGITEYWLIDPVRQWAELYIIGKHGRYEPMLCGSSGMFQSSAIEGFWLNMDWLWEPPPILQTLRELNIISNE